MKKLMLALTLALSVMLLQPALASARTPTLKQLAKTVAALQKKVNAQAKTITSLNGRLASAQHVLQLAPYVSVTQGAVNGVAGPSIVFRGANVQIKSATGEDDTTGTGNLVVGWDDNPFSFTTGYRSGSNNLVTGDNQTFTSYGCFLAGGGNTAAASLASVGGGTSNTASDSEAAVSGGANNVASGYLSVVSGGNGNSAGGMNAVVSGGMDNTASADSAVVSAGHGIAISSAYGWGHP